MKQLKQITGRLLIMIWFLSYIIVAFILVCTVAFPCWLLFGDNIVERFVGFSIDFYDNIKTKFELN